MRKLGPSVASAVVIAGLTVGAPAKAVLTSFETFTGSDGLSSDGCGSAGPSCNLTINIPAGSTILSATLYTSTYDLSTVAVGALTGVLSNGANSQTLTYTALPTNPSSSIPLDAGRTDVTGLVRTVVGSGSGAFTFNVTESNTSVQDGEGLFVIYSNPSLPTQTVALVDGAASDSGDTTMINFTQPLDPTAPGFVAEMRVADGFSFDLNGVTNQNSTITVDGKTLSNNVGNCDDADTYPTSCTNGNLITVGADNDPLQGPDLSPAGNPTSLANTHERFDISSLLSTGDTSITINTVNASHDDNIFALGFIVTGVAGVNTPPTSTPEPASLALFGVGLAGLGFARRRRV